MKINFESKNAFSVLVSLIWIQTILLTYIRAIIMRIPIIGIYPDYLIGLVYIIVIVMAFKEIKIYKKDFIVIVIVVLYFFMQWLIYQDRTEYLERYAIDFLLEALPLYFVGLSLGISKNRDNIINRMYILSMITIFASILYRYLLGMPMNEVASLYEGSMDQAYKLLPHCCLVAFYAVKRLNLLNFMFAVVGGVYLLMLGTRGAAMLYLIFFVLLLIIENRSKWFWIRAVVVFSGIIAFVSSSWYDLAIFWLYQKAKQFGLSVRIFDKLISGEVMQSSGRDFIRERLFEVIKENPILGYGLCADRAFANSYAHNIAIELWVEFGVVVGSVLLLACIVILLKGYMEGDSYEIKGLILSLIFACFFKLFLSGSYLDERLLFFLLGLCASNMRRTRGFKKKILVNVSK